MNTALLVLIVVFTLINSALLSYSMILRASLNKEMRSRFQLLAAALEPPGKLCAACNGPAGPDPVIVNDTVAALIGRPELVVRYFLCQNCVTVP